MAEEERGERDLPDRARRTLSCYALRLKPGQEIKECLLAYAKNKNLDAPFVLSCVGSITQATLRLANADKDNKNQVRQRVRCN